MYENELLNDNSTDSNVKKIRLAKIHYSDSRSFWLGFLCFLCPYVGFFSYIVYKEDRPKRASSCLVGALIGFFLPIVLIIVGYFLFPELFQTFIDTMTESSSSVVG